MIDTLKSDLMRVVLLIGVVVPQCVSNPILGEDHSFRTGLPICQAEIAGVSCEFMSVDTGSTSCAIDRSWARRNLQDDYSVFKVQINTPVGIEKISAFRAVPLSAGGFAVRNVDLSIVDLSGYSVPMDYQMDGILGMSFLSDKIVEFDEAKGCRFLDRLPEVGSDETVLPLRREKTGPEIEVTLPGLGTRWLVIDTGSNGAISLKKQKVSVLDRMGHVVPVQSVEAYAGQGRLQQRSMSVLRWAQVGGVRFHNILIDDIPVETIGLGVLHHFQMILDFPGSRAILRFKGDGNECHLRSNASGLGVTLKRNGRILIHAIRDGSPADGLGLKPSDEITRIDGLDPGSLGYWQLQELLSEAGKTISLRVLRDGKETEMRMTLRHTIPFPPEFPPEKPEFNPEP